MIKDGYFVDGSSIREVNVTTVEIKFNAFNAPCIIVWKRGCTGVVIESKRSSIVPPPVQSHMWFIVINHEELWNIIGCKWFDTMSQSYGRPVEFPKLLSLDKGKIISPVSKTVFGLTVSVISRIEP